MSFFKTTGLVLKVEKMQEKEFLYTIFFREYGILSVTKKKKVREKLIDSGYMISCEIATKNNGGIHTLGNIKTLAFFSPEEKDFTSIESFLSLLRYIKTHIPKGNPHYEIYDIFPLLLAKNNLSLQHIILAKLKIMALIGNLGDSHEDVTCAKILKFIHAHHFKDILRLGKIPPNALQQLENLF